ncbi:MAG: patatin-like phospholipase family protein [Bacteroidales bacterium]|nr:patatin-like phospholipase family protein [Bacteroidales bacterium]
MLKKIFLVCLCITLCFSNIKAQKVALVLSGGGAKGIAHIGVIKALEQNGIRIDYVAGTSMGAIIAGLYASGYSPDEMEEIFLSKEFPNWISGNIGDEYIYYFKKNEPDASQIEVKFNFDTTLSNIILPSNIISPSQMDFEFMRIFSRANALCNNNFDSLFVPFRCVASDIEKHEGVVLRNGDLSKAVRASMTYPFYFRPIKIDGRLMFDGGMYNNFPVDVVKEDFFPDIIIGSKVAKNNDPPKEDDILSQIESMLVEKTDYSLSIEDNGVLIEPNVKPVNVLDFSNTAAFVDSGYIATLRKLVQIKALVKDTVTYKEIVAKRQKFKERLPKFNINKIHITGLNDNQKVYINKSILHNLKNPDIEDVKKDYFKIIADDKIESIFPTSKYNYKKGGFDLFLNCKKANNIVLNIGNNISSNMGDEAFFSAQYKYLGRKAISVFANTSIGRFYSSGQLKTRIDYPTKLPFYIETDITANQWNYSNSHSFFIDYNTPSYMILYDGHINLDVGIPSGNKAKFVFGMTTTMLREEYFQNNTYASTDTLDVTKFNAFSSHLQYEYNTLNRKQYADKGVYLLLDFKYVNGKEKNIPGSTSNYYNQSINNRWLEKNHNWVQLDFKYDKYFKRYKLFSFGLFSELLLSNRPLFNNYTASIINTQSFQPVPEMKKLFIPEFKSHSYFSFGVKNILHFTDNFKLRLEAYMYNPYKILIKNSDYSAKYGEEFLNRYFLASSVLVYHTPIGPLSVSLNWYDRNKNPFVFEFNFGYIIYHKRFTD